MYNESPIYVEDMLRLIYARSVSAGPAIIYHILGSV